MLYIPDPDSSSEESEDSVSIVDPSDKNLIYEEDIFEDHKMKPCEMNHYSWKKAPNPLSMQKTSWSLSAEIN